MKRMVILLYGVTGYALGVAALVYLIAFLFNLHVPKSIDSGAAGNTAVALGIDLALIALFGMQHSIMARSGFKSWLTGHVPQAAERSTFMLATATVVFLLCLFWQPLPDVIWQVDSPAAYHALLGIGLAGWGLVLYATFLINHFDLLGLRQVWLYFIGREYSQIPFRKVALYKYMRHPIMTGVFVGMWVAPVFTSGHLLFAAGMSVYILIGVYHEEKDLIRAFGDRYRQYMQVTGRYLPAFVRKQGPSQRPAEPGA
jgi:protein-S-isoprenylcysteine O-methyltransferase Ste14